MMFILGLLRGFWKYLAVAVAAIAGILIYGAKKKGEGRAEEKAKHTEDVLHAKQKMDAVDEPSTDDTIDRLRDHGF